MNSGKQFIEVAGRIGPLCDAVKSGLQLLATLAFADVECRAQQRLLPFKRNKTDAEINPAGLTLLGDDAILVARRSRHAALAVAEALPYKVAVLGMDQFPGVEFQNFITGIAGNHFAAAVAKQEPGPLVNVNGRGRGLSHRAELAFTLAQRFFRMFPFRSFDRQRDQVGHGAGEILFIEGPTALASRMGGAKDAKHLSAGANRGVDESGGAVLNEMETVKLLGARIGGCVFSVDGAFFCDRAEIVGRIAGEELSSALVLPAAAHEFLFAAQSGTVVIEEPDAGAVNLEHFSGGLCDFLQGLGEVATVYGLALREFAQDLVLPAQTPLVFHQRVLGAAAFGNILHRSLKANQVAAGVAHAADVFRNPNG